MPVFSHNIVIPTKTGVDVHDITGEVQDFLSSTKLEKGIVCVFAPGSTAAITAIEYESGAVRDFAAALERIAPENFHYAHNERWHDGNGFSHVRSALIGASFSAPFNDGKLALGTWQQIVLLDFDNRDRNREVIIQVYGE